MDKTIDLATDDLTQNCLPFSDSMYWQVSGKSKMKKAFCEPKNIDFCPPIAMVSVFGFGLGAPGSTTSTFTIPRTAENGGDVTFTSRSDLETSFANEDLHPGDLKTATMGLIMDVLERVSSAIKADGEATKASKTLKATQKKLAKKK